MNATAASWREVNPRPLPKRHSLYEQAHLARVLLELDENDPGLRVRCRRRRWSRSVPGCMWERCGILEGLCRAWG